MSIIGLPKMGPIFDEAFPSFGGKDSGFEDDGSNEMGMGWKKCGGEEFVEEDEIGISWEFGQQNTLLKQSPIRR